MNGLAIALQSGSILLREGVGAMLVIGGLAAFLTRAGARAQVSALYTGAVAAIVASIAAAVVFAREVDQRTKKDPRVAALEKEMAAASDVERRRLRSRHADLVAAVRSEKLGEVADEFDRTHSVQRALAVGSLDRILPAKELRPYLVDAIQRGMAKEMERIGR